MPGDSQPHGEGRVLPVIQHMVKVMAGQGRTYCGQFVYDEDMETLLLSYASDWIAVTCPECVKAAAAPQAQIPVLVIPVDEAEALLGEFCRYLVERGAITIPSSIIKEFIDGHPQQTQSLRAAARRTARR